MSHITIGACNVTQTQLMAVMSCNTKEAAVDASLTLFQRLKDALFGGSNRDNIERLWNEVRESNPEPASTEIESSPNEGQTTNNTQTLTAIISKLRETCTDETQLQFLDDNLHFVEYQGNYALKFGSLIVPNIAYTQDQLSDFMIQRNNDKGHQAYWLLSGNTTLNNLHSLGHTLKTLSDHFIRYLASDLNSQNPQHNNYAKNVLQSWYRPLTSEQQGRFIAGLMKHCEPTKVINALPVYCVPNDVKSSVINQLIRDKNPSMFTVFRTLYGQNFDPQACVSREVAERRKMGYKPSAHQVVSQMIQGAHMYQNLVLQTDEKYLEYQCCALSLLLLASRFGGASYQDAQGTEKTVCAESLAGEAWDAYHSIENDSSIGTTSNTHWKNFKDIMEFDAQKTLERFKKIVDTEVAEAKDAQSKNPANKVAVDRAKKANTYLQRIIKAEGKFALCSLPEGYDPLDPADQKTLSIAGNHDKENPHKAQPIYKISTEENTSNDKKDTLERDTRCGTAEQFDTLEKFSDSQKQAFYLLYNAYAVNIEITQGALMHSSGLLLVTDEALVQKKMLESHRDSPHYRKQAVVWATNIGFEKHGLSCDADKLSKEQRQAAIELFLRFGLKQEVPTTSKDQATQTEDSDYT